MFRVALMIVVITVGVNRVSSATAEDILSCMGSRATECMPFFVTAMADSSSYGSMCTALRNLIVCVGTDLLCEEMEWNGVCYGTILEDYLEDTNVCGDGSGSGTLEEAALGKRCLDIMVETLTVNPSPCVFFGEYAKCILNEDKGLSGEILDGFREGTRGMIRDNYPITVGDITVSFCPDWSTTYAAYLD